MGSGRYRSENESPSTRARSHNVWIKYFGEWYTPGEFEQKFGNGTGIGGDQIQLLNPIPSLILGREMIQQMIRDNKPAINVLNALERLFKFEDKIRLHNYQPTENQMNVVSWPDKVEYVPIGHPSRMRNWDPAGEIRVNEWRDDF